MSEINRSDLFGKLDTLLYRALEGATAFCKLRGNPHVELVHWLHQIMHEHDSDLQKIIRYFELNPDQLERGIVALRPFRICLNIWTMRPKGPGFTVRSSTVKRAFAVHI